MATRPTEQSSFRGVPGQQPESASLIDQYSTFDGTYNSARDLRVEGKITGTIVCNGTLHIAQGAVVKATVEAEAISVAGELEGEVRCRGRLELLPSGQARGQISTRSIIIHEGAVYEGDLDMGGGKKSQKAKAEKNIATVEKPSDPAESAASPTEEVAVASEQPTEEPVETISSASRSSSFIRRFGTGESNPLAEASEE